MPFNSVRYFVFLAAVLVVSRFVSGRFRWIVLLLASILFYAATRAPYLLTALLLVSVATYAGGRCVAGRAGTTKGSLLFWSFVGFDLLVLISIKYVPAWLGASAVVSAVGVSYYAFQAISYLVDVYAEIQPPETHFGHLALYLAFFPKLLQGPIERAGDLLPQLRAAVPITYENLRAGLLLFAWGLFKKVVIADRLGLYVDWVYVDVQAHPGLPMLLATYFYAGQIYYDFSGYTDMALGSARLFGVRLTQNFRAPYLATSIADFWRRWHISFSRWILDYIFKPLQMVFRSAGTAGTAVVLMVTFLVVGAWHGAKWTFVIWGLLHGMYMAASVLTARLRRNPLPALLRKIWQTALTFNLVSFAWIFFRANSLRDALYVVTHFVSGAGHVGRFLLSQGKGELLIALASVAVAAAGSSWDTDGIAGERLRTSPTALRWSVYYGFTAMLLFLSAGHGGRFIYFQF